MHLISIGIVAAATTLFGFLTTANAANDTTDTILVAGIGELSSVASLAWAGEDESFSSLRLADSLIASNHTIEPNVDLLAAIAAPEPPAIVLAGMAIGGLFCGRSLLRKRHVASVKETC